MSSPARPAPLSETAEKFVRPLRAKPGARLRLYMFPFAGGGMAAFQAWPDGMGPQVEVCPVRLPGRESRYAEKPFTRMQPLAQTLAEIIDYESRKPGALPFVLFGHSLGAVLSYEVTRALSPTALGKMKRLIVSGRYSPPEPPRNPPVHHLTDKELVDQMVERYNGIPQAVLDVPELLDLILPPLRADMEMIETYTYAPGPKLKVPMAALGGREDLGVPQESLDKWGELTDGEFETHMFDGGHFFIQSHLPQVLPVVRRLLGL